MKLLFLCIAMSLATLSSFSQTEQRGPFIMDASTEIEADNKNPVKGIILIIGRKSKGCSGFGLCKLEITITWDDIIGLFFRAQQTNSGNLAVRFGSDAYNHNKSKLPNDYFVIEEDFKLDNDAAQALGFKNGYTIKKGKYKITYDTKTKSYNTTF